MDEVVFDYLMRFVTGIVLGGIIGSFITMLTFRLPRQKSLFTPPSSCPACRKRIKWIDMIPVVSYLLLKGKCRACGAEYGKRYFNIELTSVIGTTLALVCWGLGDQGFMVVVIFAVVYTIGILVAQQGKID